MEVYKKKGDSKPGKVMEFDGHTATVQWEDGSVEDVQKNILTKQAPAQEPAKTTTELPSSETKKSTMVQWDNEVEEVKSVKTEEERKSMLSKIKERLVKAIKKEGIRKNPNTQAFVATNSPADDSLANQMGYTQTVPASIQFLGKKKGT